MASRTQTNDGGGGGGGGSCYYFYPLMAAAASAASTAAAGWYAWRSENMVITEEGGGDFIVRNYFVNVWFCLLLAFLFFQNVIIQTQDPMSRHGRAYLVLNNGYFVCVSILCLEMAASWDVYGRDDVALLSAIGVAAGIINIYSLSTGSLRNKRERRFRRTIEPTRSSSSTEKTSLILGEEELGENYRQALEEERRRRGGSGGSEGQGVAGGVVRCCSTINAAAKVSVLAAACFMFGGAILHGMGTQSFPPTEDGDFLFLDGIEAPSVYYKCGGISSGYGNESDPQFKDSPVLVLHGNPDQGVGDFLGLADLMEEAGIRHCLWDRPGIGFSDYATPDNLRNPDKDLIKFIKSLSEKEASEGKGNFSGPYFLLGFQSGGLDALAAAAMLEGEGVVKELDDCHGICLKAAFFIAKISNVLLVDTVLPNFKERALQEVFGEAPEKAEAQMGDLLQRELETVQFLNRVSVPLGLTRLLGSGKNTSSWQPDSAREQRWYDDTEKAWVARWAEVRLEKERVGYQESGHNIAVRDLPVDVLMSSVEPERCLRQEDEECLRHREVLMMAAEEKGSLAAMGGRSGECSLCRQETFLYEDPSVTLEVIKGILDRLKED